MQVVANKAIQMQKALSVDRRRKINLFVFLHMAYFAVARSVAVKSEGLG